MSRKDASWKIALSAGGFYLGKCIVRKSGSGFPRPTVRRLRIEAPASDREKICGPCCDYWPVHRLLSPAFAETAKAFVAIDSS